MSTYLLLGLQMNTHGPKIKSKSIFGKTKEFFYLQVFFLSILIIIIIKNILVLIKLKLVNMGALNLQ